MAKPQKSIADRVREYLGRNLVPPEVVPLPGGGAVVAAPARFEFSGDNAKEKELLARAAAKASGIVPEPEALTAEAMALAEQANQQLTAARPQGPPR